jgi:enoyl-CoA hydratase/carnithine racemase
VTGPQAPAETVRLSEVAPGLAVIRIDRPERRNAFDLPTWQALDRCVAAFEASDTLRVAILAGSSGVFSAGGDIRASIAMGSGVAAPAGRLRYSQRVIQRLRACEKPVIAAVEGYAIGIGFSVALACDLIVASERSYFAAPHVQRGLVPDGGVVWTLVQALGRSRATGLLLFGDPLPATVAHEAGLVHEVVAEGSAEAAATALANRLVAGPQDVIDLTRRLIRGAEAATFDALLREEFVSVALNMWGPDAAEGLAAFGDRRSPDFRAARDPSAHR